MDDINYDVTNLEPNEEEFIVSLADHLADCGYVEKYLKPDFEGDDIYLRATMHEKVICEIGRLDNQTYVTITNHRLQFYSSEGDLNIIEDLKSLHEEIING